MLTPLPAQVHLVDASADQRVNVLYKNLKEIAKTKIIFGHQDALAYGVHWKTKHRSRSDVKDVCGSHPALFGWELSKLGKSGHNIDSVDFEHMKKWIKHGYKMGGIITISWHMDNFVTGGDSWDEGTRVVTAILPGGVHHAAFKAKLDLMADFVQDLKVGFLSRHTVPIIFRPWHEHTGDWFWWGRAHCTPAEYKSLWRFTVEYLRDEKQLHNLIYAYSPDVVGSKEEYLERYPGDAYVDILGVDNYRHVGNQSDPEKFVAQLEMVVDLADERGKIAALTETGYETIPNEHWWTDVILEPIKKSEKAKKLAWIMAWRNARPSHHYGPHEGHPTASNFIKFYQDPVTVFQDNLPNLYK
jgi:mannan endo-1,4-beta-mannosidase